MNADRTERRPLTDSMLRAVADYDNWWWQHRVDVDISNKITSPLYHYTDAAGLKGIVENEEIWFTSYQHLNDPGEITYGMEVANQILYEIGKNSDPIVKSFCDKVIGLFNHENVRSTLDFFIASLSRNGNDLGQWRGYGDNGRGYALGFAPHLFHATEQINSNPIENCFVFPVVYGKDKGRDLHMPAIEQALNIVSRIIVEEKSLMRDRMVVNPFFDRMAKELIASGLLLNSLMVKHPAYEQEAEVRLVICGEHNNFSNHLSTRTRNGRIIPFIKSKFPVRANGSIAEIVVGPSAAAGVEMGVRALFQYDTVPEIRRSDIPYRS